jgi:zinc protease
LGVNAVRLKATLLATAISITAATIPFTAPAQSGRSKSKAPVAEPAASPPPAEVPEAVAVVDKQQSGTTSRFLLRNGITIIINERHATQIVALVASFKADGNESSIAQLLVQLTVSKFAASIRALGGAISSTTAYDNTCFNILIAPQKAKEALAILADMIKHPAIAPDQLERQAQIVAERINDDPSAYALRRLSEIEQVTRYRVQPPGSITSEQIAEFYNRFYRPDNLIISVVGDVSTFDILVQIQKLYSDFKPAPIESKQAEAAISAKSSAPSAKVNQQQVATEAVHHTYPAQLGLRYVQERSPITRSIVSIGFQVPGITEQDWPAIEVLSAIIGQGRAARLASLLLYDQAAVSRVEAKYLPLRDKGLLAIQAQTQPDLIDKVEASIFKEADRLRRQAPQQDELARAKAVLEKRLGDRTGDYLSRAQYLARMGARAVFDYNKLIQAVGAEDVQRVAAKYLTLARLTVHEYEPLNAPPRTFDASSFAATVAQWAPGFVQPVELKETRPKASPAPVAANAPLKWGAKKQEQTEDDRAYLESLEPPPIKDFSTLHGPRAYVREDHSQPQVTIALLFHGGRVSEDETNSGITELMLRSMLYGTSRSSATELAQQLDRLGADVEFVAERDFFGLMLSVLSRNADEATRLLREMIEEPAFKDESIARARVEQIGAIRASQDSSWERSRELLFQAIFSDHPYALPPHGREEVVSRLGSDQLRAWHARTVKRQLPLVIIVGDTDGSALVSGELAEGFKRRELNQVVHIKTASAAAAAEKVASGHTQHVIETVGFVGPKAEGADLPALEVIEAAMGGSGGLLWTELIDSGLAYQASISSEALLMAQVVYISYVTSPDNQQRVRSRLREQLARLAREGLAADELEKARALAATLKLLALESQQTSALHLARAVFNRRQPSQLDQAASQILKVTADDIKRVASLFSNSSAYAGVIRPAAQGAAK